LPFQIEVQLQGGNPLYSPEFDSREAAEDDLGKIRQKIGGVGVPNVT
jgi:hypothetical protein